MPFTTAPTAERFTITTNNRERPLLTYEQLPVSARDMFDYMLDARGVPSEDSYTPRFVRAYGSYYDTLESVPAPDSYRARGWNTVMTESAFHALVFRWFDADGYALDGVVVGWTQW